MRPMYTIYIMAMKPAIPAASSLSFLIQDWCGAVMVKACSIPPLFPYLLPPSDIGKKD